MNDLGTLPGGYGSAASAINNVGEVVGRADDGNAEHAFIWDNVNGMRDLNNLIPAGSGWVLQEATGINNAGQIAGTGVLNGAHRAFLLTP
jgi:probable HAF family extracellular repeat protein